MCTTAWPEQLDLTKDECKRILRHLELEAYSTIVSAFRAQGDLTKEKKKVLQDLQSMLSISTERHRAEVRRAVNDERLLTVADNMSSPQLTTSEWQVESRRLVPLMPRLVPQTAFTVTANNMANIQAEKNLMLPNPAQTAAKEVPVPVSSPGPTPVVPSVAKSPRAASPNRNVVVLPSGMSIHIKGGATSDEETPQQKRRRHSNSNEAVAQSRASIVSSSMTPSRATYSQSLTGTQQVLSPVKKISVAKSPRPHGHMHTTTSNPSQKVIIVSSSTMNSAMTTTSSVSQRPAADTLVTSTTTLLTTTTASITHPRSSVVVPTGKGIQASNGNLGNIITVATPTTNPTAQTLGTVKAASYISTARPRMKTVGTVRPRTPQVIGGATRPGVSGPVHPSPIMKSGMKPSIHIKQEGSMKIITQSAPGGAGSAKLVPRPGPAAPVVLPGSQQQALVTRNVTGGQVTASGKIINIQGSSTGRLYSASPGQKTVAGSPNVVTVNPKSLQLTAVKSSTGTTVWSGSRSIASSSSGKPNVIVVQKSQQGKRSTVTHVTGGAPGTVMVPRGGSSSISSPFEKELVSFIQKQDLQKKQIMSQLKTVPGKPAAEPQKKSLLMPSKEDGDPRPPGSRPSLLAELIHTGGIESESSYPGAVEQEVVLSEDSQAVQAIVSQPSSLQADSAQHQWVEYDTPSAQLGAVQEVQTVTEDVDASAITALLDLQAGGQAKPLVQTESRTVLQEQGDISAGQVHEEIFLIDESGNIIESSKGVLGQGDVVQILQPETSTVARQPQVQFVDETGAQVEVQIAPDTDLSQLGSLGQEIIGELDPTTGIVYTSVSKPQQLDAEIVHRVEAVSVTSGGGSGIMSHSRLQTKGTVVAAPSGPRSVDFLTSALTEANIDLDSYQLLEEKPVPAPRSVVPGSAVPHGGGLVSILNPPVTTTTGAVVTKMEQQQHQPQHQLQGLVSHSLAADLPSSVDGQPDHQGIAGLVEQPPEGSGIVSKVVTLEAPSVGGVSRVVTVEDSGVAASVISVSQPGALTSVVESQQEIIATVESESEVMPAVGPESEAIPVAGSGLGVIPTAEPGSDIVVATESASEVTMPMAEAGSQVALFNAESGSEVSIPAAKPGSDVSIPVAKSGSEVSIAVAVSESEVSIPATVPVSEVTTLRAETKFEAVQQVDSVPRVSNSTPVVSMPSSTRVVAISGSGVTKSGITIPRSMAGLAQSASGLGLSASGASRSVVVVSGGVPGASSVLKSGVPMSRTLGTTKPVITVSSQQRGKSSFIPLQDIAKRGSNATISVVRQPQVRLQRSEVSPGSSLLVSSAAAGASKSATNVKVALEPAGLDTAHMKIEDFTSQKLDTASDASLMDSGGSDSQSDYIRLSKRKRKAPTQADEVSTPSHLGGWVRLALGLLQKVSKFRGAYKEKGEMNAASWFTHPVNPEEVPDYYDIIKLPMDFNTIKRKLESSSYQDWDDFHADMMLVKDNCFQYNPEGSEVRHDCIEVFNFYLQEYDKVFLKWQQVQLAASPKKVRLDRSPIR